MASSAMIILIAAEVLSSIIGGAASLAGAGVNAASAAMSNRRAYKWSKKYFDYQNQQNLALYSPAQQMARLQAAGLNPHLVTGAQNSSVGSMNMGEYQNPIDGNALPNAVGAAYNMWLSHKQQRNQDSQTQSDVALKQANTDKANADAARINYYNSMIQPWEAVTAKNKSDISKYQIGYAKLQNQKLLNDISLFSLQKQKYQLGIDLMEIERKYSDEYHKWRNESVKYDSKTKQAEAGIRGLDLKNYQQFGIRPQDPYYMRMGANVIGNLRERGGRLGQWLDKWFGDD